MVYCARACFIELICLHHRKIFVKIKKFANIHNANWLPIGFTTIFFSNLIICFRKRFSFQTYHTNVWKVLYEQKYRYLHVFFWLEENFHCLFIPGMLKNRNVAAAQLEIRP